MVQLLKTLLRKNKDTGSDLTPRGVARTIADQKADFNTTFQHIHKQLQKLWKDLLQNLPDETLERMEVRLRGSIKLG